MVDEFLEWLGRADMAEVEQHLVPEACVKQVQYRVLGAADIEVDHAGRSALARPILLGLFGNEAVLITRIAVAEVIPARASPLRHRVGLADRAIGQLDPIGGLAEQRIGSAAWLVIFERRRKQRQLGISNGAVMPVLPHDRKRLAPVALTRKKPVAEFVLNAALAFAVRLEPIDHLRLGVGSCESVEKAGIDGDAGVGDGLKERGRPAHIFLMESK